MSTKVLEQNHCAMNQPPNPAFSLQFDVVNIRLVSAYKSILTGRKKTCTRTMCMEFLQNWENVHFCEILYAVIHGN